MLVKSLSSCYTARPHFNGPFPYSHALKLILIFIYLREVFSLASLKLWKFPVWLCHHFVMSVSPVPFWHLTNTERQLLTCLCESQVLKDYSSRLFPGQYIYNCYNNSKITSVAPQLWKGGNGTMKWRLEHSTHLGIEEATMKHAWQRSSERVPSKMPRGLAFSCGHGAGSLH